MNVFVFLANPPYLVGWILTLRKIGDIFHLRAFSVWHSVMVVYMCSAWIILFAFTAVAFWRGQIFNASSEEVIRNSEKHVCPKDIEKSLFKNKGVVVSVSSVNSVDAMVQTPEIEDASQQV